MSGVTFTFFCCGRTQSNRTHCEKCGIHALTGGRSETWTPSTPPTPLASSDLRWFLIGCVVGGIVFAGVGLLTFAIAAWAFSGGLR